MSNKYLPFNNENLIDYEKQLIGCYTENVSINKNIKEDVFIDFKHKIIFPVIYDLKKQGLNIDITILVGELKKRDLLDRAGGASYVADLTTCVSTVNKEFYENEILRAYKSRYFVCAIAHAKKDLEEGRELEEVENEFLSTLKLIRKIETTETQSIGILFKELYNKVFPPDDCIIENLIYTGLTVFTGSSKIGKSWTVLQLIVSVDQGTYFLGKLKANKNDCLYLALEDTEKRVNRRLKKQNENINFNNSTLVIKKIPIHELKTFLIENKNIKVVIIDTFQKMMGLGDMNGYAETVRMMSQLKELADELNIAVIVVHHNRKGSYNDIDHMESALGSTGINATADCTLTLKRKRGSQHAQLLVSGRDVEDVSYKLFWDKDCCSYTITNQETLKPFVSKVQEQILGILKSEEKIWTNNEIIQITGESKQMISNELKKLQEKGIVTKLKTGQWQLIK